MKRISFPKSFGNLIFFFILSCVLVCGCSQQETATSPQPGDAPAISKQDPRADALIAQGVSLIKGGKVPEAINHLKAALAIDPENSEAHLLIAQTAMQLKEYEEAIKHFMEVIRIEPSKGEAYLLLGGCYELSGNDEKALEFVKTSIVISRATSDVETFKKASAILQNLTNLPSENQ